MVNSFELIWKCFATFQDEVEKLQNKIYGDKYEYSVDNVRAKFDEAIQDFDNYRRISNDAINNLKGQVEYLKSVSVSQFEYLFTLTHWIEFLKSAAVA